MESLFNPRAVAVIGVSEKPGSLGTAVLRNLVRTGYAGRIVPVHPRLETIEGLPCVAAIADLPNGVDTAFLSLPAGVTVEAVEQLAAAGVSNVIVGASGYAEGGDDEGIALQLALGAAGARCGIRIVGPNCNGIYSGTHRVSIGFNSGHERVHRSGGLAILSHSGALFDLMARRLDALGAGLSMFVSVGNEVLCDVLDYLEHAIDDPATRAVALLLDAVPSADRFRELAWRARSAGKPIVVLKLGQSELGGAAATAHSSRLVGDADAYAAFFDSCGVPTVGTLEGLITAGVLLDRHGYRDGGMVAFSTSGAGASLMADMADRHAINLPPYEEATLDALGEHLRYGRLLNPTDIGSLKGMAAIDDVLDRTLGEDGVGVFAGLVHTMPGASRERFVNALGRASAAHDVPVVMISPGGLPDDVAEAYRAIGAMVLSETDCAFEAIAAMLGGTAQAAAALPQPSEALAPLRSGRMLTEPESLALLARFGVAIAETREVGSAEDAMTAASEIGFPVALKGVVQGVAHKSEAGLIRLGLEDMAAVGAAFASMNTPRVIVQAMRRGDIEAMVGVTRSADVGLVLVAGLGGVFVEALRQTVSWALPVDRASVARRLDASPLGRVLLSTRWRHPGSRDALIDAIMSVQELALQAGSLIEAAEINPLVIGADGAIAVDGLVIPAQPSLDIAA